MNDKEKIKVIELLEDCCEWCVAQNGFCQAKLNGCTITDALALLKEQCPTCRNTGKIKEEHTDTEGFGFYVLVDCPDCQSQEPEKRNENA